jgi:DNA (cytosine-5)-methyltransferase 1
MASTCKKLRAIDLFSGAGGLTEGLKLAGFRVIGAVEVEEVARKTYEANHSEVKCIWDDIREVSGTEIMKKLGLRRGELDLLAGCPPCQGFSTIRTKRQKVSVEDARNNLIFEFLRLVEELIPRAIMLENVPGLVKDERMQCVLASLQKLGYYTGKHVLRIADAADFGVPQRRRRMILMTSLEGRVKFPAPTRRKRTVKGAIGRLPKPGNSGDPLHDLMTQHSPKILERISAIPKNGGSRSALGEQLECHKRLKGFNDVYGRMSWKDVAPTITSGCFNPSKGRFIHPEQNRAITLREAALLQGFRGNYRFSLEKGKTAAGLMIGNALPPLFVKKHAEKIIQKLGKDDL